MIKVLALTSMLYLQQGWPSHDASWCPIDVPPAIPQRKEQRIPDWVRKKKKKKPLFHMA